MLFAQMLCTNKIAFLVEQAYDEISIERKRVFEIEYRKKDERLIIYELRARGKPRKKCWVQKSNETEASLVADEKRNMDPLRCKW